MTLGRQRATIGADACSQLLDVGVVEVPRDELVGHRSRYLRSQPTRSARAARPNASELSSSWPR